MKTKLFYLLTLISFLASCQKDNNTTEPTGAKGKIKRVIFSEPGSREADIFEFKYDASGRVIQLNTRDEDSSFTPVRISDVANTTFFYQGSDEKPYRDSFFSAYSNKSYFYYDSQNRVIKREAFDENGRLDFRNLHEYGTGTINVKEYNHYGGTDTLSLYWFDTAFVDNQGQCSQLKYYVNPNRFLGEQKITYDSRPNPFALLNIIKYLQEFSDEDGFYYDFRVLRGPNNISSSTSEMFGVGGSTQTTTITYNFGMNTFPSSAIAVTTSTYPNSIPYTESLAYEYY